MLRFTRARQGWHQFSAHRKWSGNSCVILHFLGFPEKRISLGNMCVSGDLGKGDSHTPESDNGVVIAVLYCISIEIQESAK